MTGTSTWRPADEEIRPVLSPSRSDQPAHASEVSRLCRMPGDGGLVGAPAPVHAVRKRGLLRRLEESARHETFSRHPAPDYALAGTRRDLGLVFRRRGRLRPP